MSPTKMYENLMGMEYNRLLFELADIFKDDANAETMIMLAHLTLYDLDVVKKCSNADDFKIAVLEIAKKRGEYAGMVYDEDDFLDQDDENFSAPDDGLSWIAFADAWDALQKVAI